jgi:cysteine desulfurase/selenocysteine lyase
MIDTVEYHKSTWNDLPLKFEAGTPMMAEAVALGKAIDYLEALGREKIASWEEELTCYLINRLSSIESIRLIGTAFPRGALQSFVLPHIHPLDLATLLDLQGVAVRSGHMCCQPLVRRFGLTAVVRASLAFYNTKEEIDQFIEAIFQVQKKLLG